MKLNEKLELIEATVRRLNRETQAFNVIVKQREDITRPDWEAVNSKFNTQRRKIDLIKNELRALRRNRTVPQKGCISSYRFSFGRGQMVSIDN